MYKRALDIDPGHVNILCNYGVLLRNKGDLDGAEAMYKRGLVLYVHTPTYAAAIHLYLKYPTRQHHPLSLCKTNMRTYTIAQ
jgi:Tfp pilus assembly protein PilF